MTKAVSPKDDLAPEPSVKPGKEKGRYRKVEVRTWGDEKFRNLSPLQPSGQGLWLYLITGPHTGPIPGLFRAGRAAMAEELDWDIEAFDEAFREAFAQGMVKADFKARVMWLPSAIKHNRPESPNVVRSWATEFDLIPECDLKREAFESLKASIHALGESFAKAFDETLSEPSPKPSAKPSPKAMPNQEQEQEQEQQQEQQQEQDRGASPPPGPPAFSLTPSAPPPAPTPAPAAKPGPAPAPKPRKAAAPKEPPPTVGTWKAYSQAYAVRYHVEPVRNATVNGQLAQLVGRLGADEAPAVAAFYVRNNNARYVNAGHSVGTLLMDAEKLRTEWATGHQNTQTQARLADRAQSNLSAFAPLINASRTGTHDS